MQIKDVVELIPDSLYAVHYEEQNSDEFKRLFDMWNDVEYLYNFFENHKSDLNSDFWGNISIQDAIRLTRKEAKQLSSTLLDIAKKGNTNRLETLSTLFKPLHNKTVQITPLEPNKTKGNIGNKWLRIYAIRIAPNLFVVSGGAIKLTETMNDRQHLIEELHKLTLVKQFLSDESNYDDFEIFELFV